MEYILQSPALFAVLSVTAVAFVIQIYYYLFVFNRIGKTCKQSPTTSRRGVSVVICARNESDNLKKYLPGILKQNYPEFEVIVVNNCSNDDSDDVLAEMQTQYPGLQIRNLTFATISVTSRSVALGVGIKAAKYNRIVLTNAYCGVNSANWLSSLLCESETGLVTGYTRQHGSGCIRAEEYFNSLFELGYARSGKAYAGNENNCCFDKSFFFKHKGFNSYAADNDKVEKIFFNLLTGSIKTKASILPDAINDSYNIMTFKNWFGDKTRLKASQRFYRRGTRNVRSTETLSRLSFYVSLPFAAYFSIPDPGASITVASIIAARLLIQIIVFARTQSLLGEKNLLAFSIFWDIFSLLYLPAIRPAQRRNG